MVIDVSDSVISILDRLKYDLENGELVSPNNIVRLRLGEKNNKTPYDIILDKKFRSVLFADDTHLQSDLFIENCYISATLNDNKMVYYFGDSEDEFSNSKYAYHGNWINTEYGELVRHIDWLYKCCKDNEEGNKKFKYSFLLIIKNIECIPLFCDILNGNHIQRQLYYWNGASLSQEENNAEIDDDPVAAINRLFENINSKDEQFEDECPQTFATIAECYNEAISVEQEFEEILRFKNKFDVSFIISTSDNRVREILKEKYSFDIEIDCNNNLIIISDGIEENRISPYKKSTAADIGEFLCSNWSRFQAILDYTSVSL